MEGRTRFGFGWGGSKDHGPRRPVPSNIGIGPSGRENIFKVLPMVLRRTQEKTDFIISTFDPGTVWDDFGIRSDITVGYLLCHSRTQTDLQF